LLQRKLFKPVPSAVPQARRTAADALARAGLASWPATLLISELAANAVDHARTEFELRILLGRRLRVEVRDASQVLPARCAVDAESERGRGLHLLDCVAAAWGIRCGRRGKTVWFELDPSAVT
jgi:anti-sigma regulatory factor (Ser/Thr protein kinase)